MRIQSMFKDDINRKINGVVKVDQDESSVLVQELNEYVITRELKKHFITFFNNYIESFNETTADIGVWISGFFGSGKSHFLKILSYLLSKDINAFKFEVSTGCGLMGIHHTFPLDGDMMYSIYKRLYGKIRTIAFDLGSPGDESHQVEAVRKIASDFPSFNIVVCHLSSPRRNQDENIKRELEMLQKDNIFFDTAALFWKTRVEEYPFTVARSYLTYARDIVGAEHLMWGSDAPSTLVQVPLSEQLSYSKGIFSEKEEEWYFYKTAEKVYF